MRTIFLSSVLLVAFGARAIAASQASIEADRAAYSARLKSSPTSYLTLNDMAYLETGQSVYLDLTKPAAGSKWLKKKPAAKASLAAARESDEVWLTVAPEGERSKLEPGRFWKAANGLIVAAEINRFNTRLRLHDPEHPAQKRFEGLSYFPYSAAAVVQATFTRAASLEPITFETSRQSTKAGLKIGRLEFTWAGAPCALDAYTLDAADKITTLFLPFKDKTSGRETYGGGRYLDLELPPGELKSGALTVDFNEAYNPLCARTPFYNCVVVPGRPLPVAIAAGEKSPKKRP